MQYINADLLNVNKPLVFPFHYFFSQPYLFIVLSIYFMHLLFIVCIGFFYWFFLFFIFVCYLMLLLCTCDLYQESKISACKEFVQCHDKESVKQTQTHNCWITDPVHYGIYHSVIYTNSLANDDELVANWLKLWASNAKRAWVRYSYCVGTWKKSFVHSCFTPQIQIY